MKRTILAAALSTTLAGLLLADLLPPGSSWNCFSGGQNIGSVNVAQSGNMFNFNDNPNTNHPPNTSGSWAVNSAGDAYGNGSGHTTTFTDNGDGTYDLGEDRRRDG